MFTEGNSSREQGNCQPRREDSADATGSNRLPTVFLLKRAHEKTAPFRSASLHSQAGMGTYVGQGLPPAGSRVRQRS